MRAEHMSKVQNDNLKLQALHKAKEEHAKVEELKIKQITETHESRMEGLAITNEGDRRHCTEVIVELEVERKGLLDEAHAARLK